MTQVLDAFTGPLGLPLDNRTVAKTIREAYTMLNKVGAEGLQITVLNEVIIDSKGGETLNYNPTLYISSFIDDKWILKKVDTATELLTTKSITVSEPIGALKYGEVIPVGTSITDILERILDNYVAPTINVRFSHGNELFSPRTTGDYEIPKSVLSKPLVFSYYVEDKIGAFRDLSVSVSFSEYIETIKNQGKHLSVIIPHEKIKSSDSILIEIKGKHDRGDFSKEIKFRISTPSYFIQTPNIELDSSLLLASTLRNFVDLVSTEGNYLWVKTTQKDLVHNELQFICVSTEVVDNQTYYLFRTATPFSKKDSYRINIFS